MQRNTLMFVLAGVVAVFVGGYFYMTKSAPVDSMATAPEAVTSQPVVPIVSQPIAPVPATPVAASKVKEFTMTAYYDDKGAWYSLKEMTVKKGDTVRVTITNTKGMHNFNIDELGVKSDLPLNTPVIVEFTAEKAGDFVYYCAMPGHRAKGQWGTLHVTQ